MRVETRRDALLIIPESDIDRAYLEDTLGLSESGQTAEIERVNDVSMGFSQSESFVLRMWSYEKAVENVEEGKKQ